MDGKISHLLLVGDIEGAVNLCLHLDRYADALFLAVTGGPELLAHTQRKYIKQCKSDLSRLMSAVVMEDWSYVIHNCVLTCWKEALAAIVTYAREEDFSRLVEALGDRLLRENNVSLQKNSLLCYICAGNLDKFVSAWNSQATAKAPDELQNIIEKVMILKESMALQGIKSDLKGGPMSSCLVEFATLLASQGSLLAALTYLEHTAEEKGAALRDRLYISLGYKIQPANIQQPVAKSYGAQMKSHQAHPSSSVNPGVRSYENFPKVQEPQKPDIVPPPVSQVNSYPPPSATASLSRRAHVADPTIYSPNTGFQPYTGGYGDVQNQYQQPASFNSNQYTNGTSQPPANIYNPNTAAIPSVNESQVPPVTPSGYPSGPPPPSLFQTPPGWNDPPQFKTKSKPPGYISAPGPDPIVHPIFGTSTPQQNVHQTGYPGPSPTPPLNPQAMAPVPPAPVVPPHPSSTPPSHLPPHQNQPITQQQQQPIPTPRNRAPSGPTAPKAPIPQEHAPIKDALDMLTTRCMNAAVNPIIKRKIEDIARKLETLYDKLREEKLSQQTLQGLHSICSGIQSENLHSCLAIHTQMVSGGNFTEMSSFMPGLKVLLQIASQLPAQ